MIIDELIKFAKSNYPGVNVLSEEQLKSFFLDLQIRR